MVLAASTALRIPDPEKEVTVTTSDAPARLSRPDAARYLGLSIGTLRNYHQQGKLSPEVDERGQWWYPLATLDEFVSVNQLLCSRGIRPARSESS
jgi:hypothetical protein